MVVRAAALPAPGEAAATFAVSPSGARDQRRPAATNTETTGWDPAPREECSGRLDLRASRFASWHGGRGAAGPSVTSIASQQPLRQVNWHSGRGATRPKNE